MRKEEKHEVVLALTEQIDSFSNLYIADTSNLTVAAVNTIRRKCFESDIKMQVAKNTLIKKALEAAQGDYAEMYDVLKGSSTIMFSNVGNAPAKLIKSLRVGNAEKPLLKAAYIDTAIYIGDDQLNNLVNLKSKDELIGEIIGLLQSPAKNVISGLQSGKAKLAGIVKTLEQRG